MIECRLQDNRLKCNCTYEPCSRKGRCCECLRYHWQNRELPACFFPGRVEKTFDRSLAKFIEIYSK